MKAFFSDIFTTFNKIQRFNNNKELNAEAVCNNKLFVKY